MIYDCTILSTRYRFDIELKGEIFLHCLNLTYRILGSILPIRLFWKFSKKGATQKLGFQKYNNYNRWYFNIYPSWTIGVLRLFVVLETFQKGAPLNINKTPSFQYLARLNLFEVLHSFVLEIYINRVQICTLLVKTSIYPGTILY